MAISLLRSLAAAVLVASFAACGSSRSLTDGSSLPAMVALGQARTIAPFFAPKALRASRGVAAGFLYVANRGYVGKDTGSVTTYAEDSATLLRTIGGVSFPQGLAVDRAGDLYVANCPVCGEADGAGSIAVYSSYSKGSRLLRTMKIGIASPRGLTLDNQGNLYVINYGASGDGPFSVTEYAANSMNPSRTIKIGGVFPTAIAPDASGNVYIAEGNSIDVYAAGKITPDRRIEASAYAQGSLIFDKSGNLYAADGGYVNVFSSYSRGNVPLYTIDSSSNAGSLAFDNTGNLYVAIENIPGAVTTYRPGTNAVLRAITTGIDNPVALSISSSGNLYVANLSSPGLGQSPGKKVTVYAPGSATPFITITNGVENPGSLAFSAE